MPLAGIAIKARLGNAQELRQLRLAVHQVREEVVKCLAGRGGVERGQGVQYQPGASFGQDFPSRPLKYQQPGVGPLCPDQPGVDLDALTGPLAPGPLGAGLDDLHGDADAHQQAPPVANTRGSPWR
jgi:hypothetical protein